MKKIDIEIQNINKNICKNIEKFAVLDRGFLSQNIMSQLRNFVEHVSLKAYSHGQDINVIYSNIEKAMVYVKSNGKLKFLSKFHNFLQPVASHYTIDEENSERLMLKYYEYLLKIKSYLMKIHGIRVLENIDKFPINTDSSTKDYYEKIAKRINDFGIKKLDSDRYYIQKVKPFFVKYEVFYEVTFIRANDYSTKFDRIIAFTKLEIMPNYAVRLHIGDDIIQVLGKDMPILIIDNWEVSIRPCEINNFAKIFGKYNDVNAGNKEYQNLMFFLTQENINIIELLESSDSYYFSIKDRIIEGVKIINFLKVLDKCRNIIKRNYSGNVIVRYLLYKLHNKIIKLQYNNESCFKLSDLNLKWGCLPFEQMPFTSSLVGHNPKIYDLFECINSENREHELFSRLIKNNIELKGELYTPKNEISNFEDLDSVMQKYNESLYYKHNNRRLETYKNFIYIKEYEEDTVKIIKRLKELSIKGVQNYCSYIDSWLEESSYTIDCKDKKKSLRKIFEDSLVSIIYGSAGTGKSTMINHISHAFDGYKKLYLANTNPATDNLKRKVNASNTSFKTITKFLHPSNGNIEFDLLFIDECSTVSNSDMLKVLEKASFKLLILVGDVYQIESISFGNWFSIAQSFIPESSLSELTHPYRSSNAKLLELWKKVRNIDSDILEHIAKNGYSVRLDDSIFESFEEDEIILCLNYDGLYGINNINKFLQTNNENTAVKWGSHIYKINDPILFNDTNRFGPEIYNNLKGRILKIKTLEEQIQFDIEIDKTMLGMKVNFYDFELLDQTSNGNSIIRFLVNKHKSGDEDDDSSDAVVPFQVAYAVSIHKAQGLEYSSVKIVITTEVDEMISHNILYTAITRAKDKLKIYWSPETENKILKNLEKRNVNRDVHLLKSKMGN